MTNETELQKLRRLFTELDRRLDDCRVEEGRLRREADRAYDKYLQAVEDRGLALESIRSTD